MQEGGAVSHNNSDAACQLDSVIGGMQKGDDGSKKKRYDGVVTDRMPMSRGDEAELSHFCRGRVQIESRALLLQPINTFPPHHIPQSKTIKPSFNTSTKRLLLQTL